MARVPLAQNKLAPRKLTRHLPRAGVVHEDRTDPARAGADRPWKRLVWFGALWAGSVGALGLVGLAIKLALGQ